MPVIISICNLSFLRLSSTGLLDVWDRQSPESITGPLFPLANHLFYGVDTYAKDICRFRERLPYSQPGKSNKFFPALSLEKREIMDNIGFTNIYKGAIHFVGLFSRF